MTILDPDFSVCLAVDDFQKLQEAKEVLCNEAKRKNYDLWRRSGVTITFHEWQALNDSVKTVCIVLLWYKSFTPHPDNSESHVIYLVLCL